MKYLTLLIIDERDLQNREDETFNDILEAAKRAPICIFLNTKLNRFKNFLKTLPLNTKFHLLFHLKGQKPLKRGRKYKGEIILTDFSIDLPGLKKHKYYFSQNDNVNDIEGRVFAYSELINHNSTDGFLNSDILNDDYLLTPTDLLYEQYNLEKYTLSNSLNEHLIGDATLKKILGACIFRDDISQEDISDVKINFLSPGYSGAYVAVISYLRKGRNNRIFRLLKFSKNHNSLLREKTRGNYLYENANLPKNFIGARLDYDGVVVGDYFCLLFNYVNADDLVNVMTDLLVQSSQESNKKLFDLLENTLEEFETFISEVGNADTSTESINPWSHPNLGLKPTKWFIIKAKFTIEKLKKLYTDEVLLNNFGLSKNDLEILNSFLLPENDKSELTRHRVIKIPLGIIHGDLHARNILVEKKRGKLKDIHFIDFALMNTDTQKKNVLLDLAHLCIDLEIAFVPKNHIETENYFHFAQSFLYNHPLDGKSSQGVDFPEIAAVYEIANRILTFSLNTYRQIKVHDYTIDFPESELILQFHLARSHYLIKRIAFDNVSNEKILFMCRLALDIFQYIKENQEVLLKENEEH